MNVTETELPGVLVIEPRVFRDPRGFFLETFQAQRYHDCGITCDFVQDNASLSSKDVVRGLHLQNPRGQDKLVYVLAGTVLDVIADVRVGSPAFGKWIGVELSADNGTQVFIPKGCAHGFCVLSDTAVFVYKCSDLYSPESEITVLWNDPDIGVQWPVPAPQVSEKDQKGQRLRDIDSTRLLPFAGSAP